MTKSRRSFPFVCLRILFSTTCIASITLPALAQDAFGSGFPEDYPVGDSFGATGTQMRETTAPTLQGMTNGTIACPEGETSELAKPASDRMPRDQYDKLVSMPDPRIMLGASLCDLTLRDMPGDEELAPANFPPMPKAMSLPANIDANLVSVPRGEEFGATTSDFNKWNLGSTAYAVRRRVEATGVPSINGYDDVRIDKDLMARIMDVGAKCGDNSDYDTRIAAFGLKYAHPECRTFVAPDFLIDIQSKLDPPEIQELKRTLSFREHVAAIPASTLNANQRASLATRLEGENKLFDALVERLSVVDANNDGVSRYYLARLFCQINENKLAYETLREGLASTWGKSERAILQKSYNLIGNILLRASRNADRLGRHDLALVRMRNASVAFRRAIIIDPHDNNSVDGLLRIAKQAIIENPNFDNYLLLGSSQMLFGDIEKADLSYAQCAQLLPNEPRLRMVKAYKKQLKLNSDPPRKAASNQLQAVH